ncbi:MAG TPA: dTDP-4-amino-4,6-dideoxygalactose transaminase [Bacteroidia bacterium]|nr:dTDP-4-amino-4,6-dideoxygalactose transaminase [Bacteroidia bacterium]
MNTIPFNKPYITGLEIKYIQEALMQGKLSGDGPFTRKCEKFFEETYGFRKTFLTTSCTDALELASLVADIMPGDEVIMPSYTFVSTANPFVLRGAKIVFADSLPAHPNMDTGLIESLITKKTKAIVPVHYAGVACDMDRVLELAAKYKLLVIEDAAQGIDSFYKDKPLGSLGDFGAFSFHDTKNIVAGEGGLITVNNPDHIKRTEIIREKGTNRSSFFRGEVDKYTWVDKGSSFLPSDLTAAFLLGQLEHLKKIQSKRIALWEQYHKELKSLESRNCIRLPLIEKYATNNGHIYYILCRDLNERTALAAHLKQNRIQASFHYQSLHDCPFFVKQHDDRVLKNASMYSNCLLRLPLFYELEPEQVSFITATINDFFKGR